MHCGTEGASHRESAETGVSELVSGEAGRGDGEQGNNALVEATGTRRLLQIGSSVTPYHVQ